MTQYQNTHRSDKLKIKPGAFFGASTIHPKLHINAPNDRYEQQADAMADRVMRMEEEEEMMQAMPLEGGIQRMCADCAEEEETLQTMPLMRSSTGAGGYEASPELSEQLQQSKGGGAALPAATQARMSRSFGADFSGVKIHTGSQAAAMNQSIQAKAFTHGSDIYFNEGQYQPGSSNGNHLLAHELTHVVQQGGKRGSNLNKVQRDPLQDPCEVGEGSYFSAGGIPPGLDCDRDELDNEAETSCCYDSALSTVSTYYQTAREYTDRAIQQMESGTRVNDMLSSHFNSDSRKTRRTVLANLQTIRSELNNQSSHIIRCRAVPCPIPSLLQIRQENPDAFCRWGVQAFHVTGTNYITMCVNMEGDLVSAWTTLLHEVVHQARVGDLPSEGDASQQQIGRGEYETYSFQRASGQYPNPTEYALRNADSYAEFIKVVGAPGYQGDKGLPGWASGLLWGLGAGVLAGGIAGGILGATGNLGSLGLGAGIGIGAAVGGAAGAGLGALFGWLAD